MPYPTQHENFYKNQVIQLQQKLQQLTETYNYRLNEAGGIINRIVTAVTPDLVNSKAWTIAREASQAAAWGEAHSAESLARQAAAVAAREAAEAALRALAARVEAFSTMSNAEIIAAINSGDAAFKRYVLEHYGQIVQVGSSYQRLLPDGTVLHTNSNGNWVPINKPGFMSAFGYISKNGRAISPEHWTRISWLGNDPGGYNIGPKPLDMSQYGLPTYPGGPTTPTLTGPGY